MMEWHFTEDGRVQIEKEGQIVVLTPEESEILDGAFVYWKYLRANGKWPAPAEEIEDA